MQQRAAGIDDRPVVPDRDEQQISAEETFDKDIADHAKLRAEIVRLADKTCARLRARQLSAGCVTVKIRRGDFTTYTRQRRFEPPTQETRVITSLATALLDAWLASQPRAALRLLGVGVSELAPVDAARSVHRAADREEPRARCRGGPHPRALRQGGAHPRELARAVGDGHAYGNRSSSTRSISSEARCVTRPSASSTNSTGASQPGARKRVVDCGTSSISGSSSTRP